LLPRKFIRGIPEANQPLQNAIYARALAKDMYLKKIKLSNVCVVGLHYGGIELPFFLDFFLKEIYSSAYVRPQYVSAHYSKYSNSDLRLQANSIVQIIDNKIISFMDKDVFLLDDGIFSATSMVDVGWLLTLAGSKVHFSAMSITNNRRMGQILDEAGADSDFLEQELANSFIRVSPFLRVCSPQEYHAQKADHRLNLVKTRARRMLTSNYSTSFQQDPYAIIRDEQIIKNPISRMNRGQSDLKP
jgi:hypothetical protein